MKFLIIANWKCNPQTLVDARGLFDKVAGGIKDIKNTEVVICPPFVYLESLDGHDLAKNSPGLYLGSQDVFWQEGAFTGEISPKMLKDSGCQYVILGHSERRKNLGETDDMINKKVKASLAAGLRPVLCLSSAKRGQEAKNEMASQLKGAVAQIEKSDIKNIVFTYEPVWAISTTTGSVVASPENTAEGKIFIKEALSELFGEDVAKDAKIIYGGSVDSKNIEGFVKEAKMDGALVGAASLRPNDFIEAVKKVDSL
jgi:triosephosphate isomerase (TIM)